MYNKLKNLKRINIIRNSNDYFDTNADNIIPMNQSLRDHSHHEMDQANKTKYMQDNRANNAQLRRLE